MSTGSHAHRRVGRVQRIIISVCLLIAATARADDWPAYQHDLAHTGYTASTFDPTKLSLSWQAPTGYASPLIVGPNVIGTHSGAGTNTPTVISSFSMAGGSVNWSYSQTLVFPSQAGYANGLVAFGTGSDSTTGKLLTVLDAQTGAHKYDVSLGMSPDVMPLMVPESNNTVTAYVMSSSTLKAVSLGATSGSVLWTATGQYSDFMMPTLVGSSVVVANAGHYYSYARTTGAANAFQTPGASGIGTTPAYDASRSELYVLAGYSGSATALTAYHYASNGSITQLWQDTGGGIKDGNSVAIGPDGGIYAVDTTSLVEFDPTTGIRLRTLAGQFFANGCTPVITGNTIWVMNNGNTTNPLHDQTVGFSLTDLSLVAALPLSRGDELTAYASTGAADAQHFITASTTTFGEPGFAVFSVPEPTSLALVACFGALPLLRRRR